MKRERGAMQSHDAIRHLVRCSLAVAALACPRNGTTVAIEIRGSILVTPSMSVWRQS
jgi:hypothetical protein